ncbi:MAG: gliding motility protein GldL [Prevotella sp.]|nr:gliding motility protein GldL [Prevotella sp.]MBQ4173352.1 gliding motility protein GldL [Prevotella sp.]
MTKYSKFNIVYRLQKWMDSVPGQTFLNYAYSWGASIVILGTLFKLTHLPGANFFLFLGMGTEVFVFFISAFDRPFDKTADGRDLPTHLVEGGEVVEGVELPEGYVAPEGQAVAAAVGGGGGVVGGSGTIIIGGGHGSNGEVGEIEEVGAVGNVGGVGNVGSVGVVGGGAWISQNQDVTPDMAEAQGNYVEELKKLTEMLGKVSEQSERLTRDSEEMENLNRTLTGICKVYEMQLKGASQQIGTIDQINEQSRKMAEQIGELNKIYARMIEAMTVNMPKAGLNKVNGQDGFGGQDGIPQ